MSDIHSTAFRYHSICMENGVKAHPYILKMFDKEKDQAALETHDNMCLYLAGNNKQLTDVRLLDNDVQWLCLALENNLYVTALDLRYNNIGDEGVKHIAKLMEESPSLTSVNLASNDFGADGAGYLAKALQKNDTLRYLRVSGNKFGNKGGMYFAQALQVNVGLEELDLCDTDLKTESVIAIASVLINNRTLKVLQVNRPLLFSHQEETTVHFANMLKVNRHLQKLHLQKYDMRDFGATRLAEHLMENFTLTYLDLSCNRITRDGTKELAKVLKKNTALQVLDLGFNRLEDDGAKHLADALATYNSTLTTLVVTSNNIKGPGLVALADALRLNITLTNIYIWGNILEPPACVAFANLISSQRLNPENTDVKSYEIDGAVYLSQLNNGLRRHYYSAPSCGDDVPDWMPRG